MQELPMIPETAVEETFRKYEVKFKALADMQRLNIIHQLVRNGRVCVCDLTGMVGMTQSKLSYHLKILLDAELIQVEQDGKWNYYWVNQKEINHLLSDEHCCIFRPPGC